MHLARQLCAYSTQLIHVHSLEPARMHAQACACLMQACALIKCKCVVIFIFSITKQTHFYSVANIISNCKRIVTQTSLYRFRSPFGRIRRDSDRPFRHFRSPLEPVTPAFASDLDRSCVIINPRVMSRSMVDDVPRQ